MLTSTNNPRVKQVVKLRKRAVRDERGLLVVEGYRELKRALDHGWRPGTLYTCPELYLGKSEAAVVEQARRSGADCLECSAPVFAKMAYRDRPEGLLAVGPQLAASLEEVALSDPALVVVAEAIEKPGNLGTILRSADAANADAVVVCDKCTDVNNPNVVRASVGTLFTRPVVEAGSGETMGWLKAHGLRTLAATPHADRSYADVDLTVPLAIVVGTEQYGLSDRWMEDADVKVRIPMLGHADSLNVAMATTILLFEAVRQRGARTPPSAGQAE
jgi:TrmH family RNA methyltransferase